MVVLSVLNSNFFFTERVTHFQHELNADCSTSCIVCILFRILYGFVALGWCSLMKYIAVFNLISVLCSL